MPTEPAKAITPGKLALTIKEAAYATGLSRSLLYVAIGRGALHARKCGARTVILDSDLRRYLRNLPRVPKSTPPSPAPDSPRTTRTRKRDIAKVEATA